MSRGVIQRMARIRQHCTTDPYQRSLQAVRGEAPRDFEPNPDLPADAVFLCPECRDFSLIDTYGEWPFRRLPPEERWFCFRCMYTGFDRPEYGTEEESP